ncbi:gnat family [Moniliophthora roreri MCA 2997]|uniref:Gnat family n=2 Tax=Moniliophthora roreri TaxID=221103 RepID=V2WKL3_MONRO|nr:gnat family [Moniliophthora roreri MCA 2997]KAI3619974.1 gnat family [Moniliophthora roreri]
MTSIPLHVDRSVYDTPFLRLPSPHTDVIIAAPMLRDVEPSVAIMSDARVRKWTLGSELSYTVDRAQKWINGIKEISDDILESMKNGGQAFCDGCPVRHIIKINGDGSRAFIGDIGIQRSNWADVLNSQERQRYLDENNARSFGDAAVAWQVGYYLSPTYEGCGIMSAALKTLIHEWAIPMMNAHRIRATTFRGNEGSKRVLEKNGFLLVNTIDDYKVIDGEMTTLYVLEWKRNL